MPINPDIDDLDDEDDDSDVAPAPLAATQPAPTAAPNWAQMAMASPTTSPELKSAASRAFNLGDYSDANRKALEDQSQLTMGDRAGAALMALGAGFSGRDPAAAAQNKLNSIRDDKRQVLTNFDKDKAQAIQDISTKKTLDDMDPNSPQSKALQNVVSRLYGDKFTPDEISSLSAADKDVVLKPLELKYKIDQTKASQQMAHEDRATRNAMLQSVAKDRQEQKQSANDDKDAKALDKHLDAGWAGRSGQAGIVQAKINAAERAQALIDQGKNQPGGLDSRQTEELSQSAANLLGGGTTASARVDALVPHTWWGGAQSLKEYLTNHPQGLQQGDFTNRLAETVQREKALAEDQKRSFQIEGLPAHNRLKKSNPDLYNQVLQGKGITPDMIDGNGQYKKKKTVVDTQVNKKTGQKRVVYSDGSTEVLGDDSAGE